MRGEKPSKQFLAPLPGTQRRYKYASPDNSQFMAPLSDSCIKNRGVARYLLSLRFSLVSLPFSFYFCVPNQKYQKYLLLLWVPMKTLSCVTSPVTTTVTLSALLLFHLPLQHLLIRLNLLCLTLS